MVQQHRWTIGVTVLVAAAMVTVIVTLGNRDGYSTADDAVRSACHPTAIVTDARDGVVWWEKATQHTGEPVSGPQVSQGAEWLASIKRDNGGYLVDTCKFKSVPHGYA